MDEISKTRMEVSNKNLERRAAEIDGIPTFKGIPATAFDKEHLVMLCKLFAEEWRKSQAQYYEALDKAFPSFVKGACAAAEFFHKPSIWRKIWKRIKRWASCTPDSAHERTKTNAKA